MKKLILTVVLLSVAGLAFAQNIGSSLSSDNTNNLIRNNLDAALSIDESLPGPDFSSLKKIFIFGGVDNLDKVINVSPTSSGALPLLGFFLPGDIPLGIYTKLNSITGASTATNSTVDTLVPLSLQKPITTGTDTINYRIRDTSTVTTQTARLANQWDEDFVALTSIGGLNFFVKLGVNVTDSSAPGSNQTVVTTHFYDSTLPSVTVAPVEATNYTTNSVTTSLSINNTFRASLGAFLKTDTLGHLITLDSNFASTDSSTSTNTTNTAPKYVDGNMALLATPNTLQNIKNVTTATSASGSATLSYKIAFDPASGEDKDNVLWAQVIPSINWAGYTRSVATNNASTSYANVANVAVGTPGITNDSATTFTNEASKLNFNIEVDAGKYLFWTTSSILRFGVQPNLTLKYTNSTNGVPVTKLVTVTKFDQNSNGSYVDNLDTVTTTTQTLTNFVLTGSGGGLAAKASTDSLRTSLSLPIGVTLSPKDFPFSFNLGTTPVVSWTNRTITTAAATSTTQTVVATGNGAAAPTVTSPVNATAASVVTDNLWSANFTHFFSLHLAIDNDIGMDVRLNASNLLNFDGLTVQLIIGL